MIRTYDISIRRKFIEACVRPRLTLATQSWRPSEQQIKQLKSCWFGFLRRMVKDGFWRKPDDNDNETNFCFLYSHLDLENIVKSKLHGYTIPSLYCVRMSPIQQYYI